MGMIDGFHFSGGRSTRFRFAQRRGLGRRPGTLPAARTFPEVVPSPRAAPAPSLHRPSPQPSGLPTRPGGGPGRFGGPKGPKSAISKLSRKKCCAATCLDL